MLASINTNNYHALSAVFTMRPTRGINLQSTYTWSKNFGITGEVGRTLYRPEGSACRLCLAWGYPHPRFPNQRNIRASVRTEPNVFQREHRSCGSHSRGLVDELDCKPQQWSSDHDRHVLGGCRTAFDLCQWHAQHRGTVRHQTARSLFPEGSSSGTYFMDGKYKSVRDPQCNAVTTAQHSEYCLYTQCRRRRRFRTDSSSESSAGKAWQSGHELRVRPWPLAV